MMDTLTEQFMMYLASGLAMALVSGLMWLIKKGIPLLSSMLKEHLHFRGSSVVVDSLAQVITNASEQTLVALKDGKLSAEERDGILKATKALSIVKLKELSGFYKDDLVAWVEDQAEVALGKLLLSVGIKGSTARTSKLKVTALSPLGETPEESGLSD
jgi:hypothetical protein